MELPFVVGRLPTVHSVTTVCVKLPSLFSCGILELLDDVAFGGAPEGVGRVQHIKIYERGQLYNSRAIRVPK